MHKLWVPSLGQEDPLEEEMAIHYSILAWEIPWTVGLQSVMSQIVGHYLGTNNNNSDQIRPTQKNLS